MSLRSGVGIAVIITLAIALGPLLLYAYRTQTPAIATVPISQAIQDVLAGRVTTVTETANRATLDLNDGAREQTNLPDNSKTDPLQDAVTTYNQRNPTRPVVLKYQEQSATWPVIGSVLLGLLPLMLFLVLPVALVSVLVRSRGDDKFAQLERIANLRDRGVLSEDEFQREKRRLLG